METLFLIGLRVLTGSGSEIGQRPTLQRLYWLKLPQLLTPNTYSLLMENKIF